MKVLAEIPSRSSSDLRAGTLRRCDLEAFGGLLEELSEARAVLLTGAVSATQTAAIGLATAAVAAGTSTILLECDLARPVLADALGLANAPGLHEHLLGKASAKEILRPVVLAGPGSAAATEPLVCVAAGRPSADGRRLLASEPFARALAGLRAAYDLVVIAGPPIRDEDSLRALLSQVDSAIACLGPSDSRSVPITVSGLVIQN